MKGLVFAIEEFAAHDGDGLRTVVFLKGCPLMCRWCHNPEGLKFAPERAKSPNGCLNCGACETECRERCTGCGECLYKCPRGLLRVVGKWWEPDALAAKILKNRALLRDGGVTISGGEPLMQPDFLAALLDALGGLHRAVETSGYAEARDYIKMLSRAELVFTDIKLADCVKHREYTGVGNERILKNLALLKESGKPFIARVPLIAGVNDDIDNLRATSELLNGARGLIRVELLPYNIYAGGKYQLVGREFKYDYHKPDEETLALAAKVFRDAGINVTVR